MQRSIGLDKVGLTEQVVKNLQDKSLEKRSNATKQIQTDIEDFVAKNDWEQIKLRIAVFERLTLDAANSTNRRSGIYGISAIAVALYQRARSSQSQYLDNLIDPINKVFTDKDAKVLLAACDAMHTIIKNYREAVLRSKHFERIFDAIITLISSSNAEVREFAKKVDDKIKDTVFACLTTKNVVFDLDRFINSVCQKFETGKDYDAPMVLIEWIDQLHSSPSVNVIKCVPRFLTKFLAVLEAQDHLTLSDLGKMAEQQLSDFLGDLKDPSARNLQLDREVIFKLTEFLMKCDESKKIALYCSLNWLIHFLSFFKDDFMALTRNHAQQLKLQEKQDEEIKEGDHSPASKSRQSLDPGAASLLRLMYRDLFPEIISTILRLKHSRRIEQQMRDLIDKINTSFLSTVIQILKDKDEFEFIFKRLKKEFRGELKNSGETQETIIQWYTELFKEFNEDLIDVHQDIFEGLIDNLNFDNSRLVKRIMFLVCMLSTKNEKYSRKVMEQLIERFYIIRAQAKFDDKIKQVITELSNSISSEKVFMEFADKLESHPDLVFVQELIERLTLVIAASPSYKSLRDILMGKKNPEYAESKEKLFFTLFKTWSYNPISTLTLCLLSKNYKLACRLIPRFTQIEMDTSKLIALGSLVQLIESPGFIFLRIELTKQDEQTKYLLRTLQGILMILPLSKSFQSLKKRLQCINIAPFELEEEVSEERFFGRAPDLTGEMSIENCLRIFDEKQEQVNYFQTVLNAEEEKRNEDSQYLPTMTKPGTNQSFARQ